ncbi:hypothetical protein [Profundibacter sp.]|uniref:hypothetical protein n=1 Tax=Profundibacter sp. TaxID=3101071 RepID=UPI003D1163D3
MENIKLCIRSKQGIEATISSDGSQSGAEDYYSIVTIKGYITEKKIYGIDPVQAFSLGLRLIEQLTEKKRLEGQDGQPGCVSKVVEIDFRHLRAG